MKSQAYTFLQRLQKEQSNLKKEHICDIAYEFSEAMAEIMSFKLHKAITAYEARTVAMVGGVSASDRLYQKIGESIQTASGKVLLRPTKKVYSTDNGAMIGVVGILS
jgi:tRNA A37 threonylcarbamoyltransferase TsaD